MASVTSIYLIKSSTQSDSKNVWCINKHGGYFGVPNPQSKEAVVSEGAINPQYISGNICFHPLVRESDMGTMNIGYETFKFAKGTTWKEWAGSKQHNYTITWVEDPYGSNDKAICINGGMVIYTDETYIDGVLVDDSYALQNQVIPNICSAYIYNPDA